MADAGSTETTVVSEAFTAARELLRQAEQDAAQLRVAADRYVRQREQEAELLVVKARRLLAAAEDKAAALVAAAWLEATHPATAAADGSSSTGPVAEAAVHVVDLDAPIALDPRVTSVGSTDSAPRLVPTGLDGILAAAIAKAVDRSFPTAP